MKDTIRDHRTNPCLWIETKLFDENIERIGVFAWAVYTVLVRHANNGNQKCSPSQERIALLLNCSRNTVAKAIKTLVDHKLITLEEKDKVGEPGRHYHEYTLLSPAKTAGIHGSRREQSKPSKSHGSSGERSQNEQELPCPAVGVALAASGLRGKSNTKKNKGSLTEPYLSSRGKNNREGESVDSPSRVPSLPTAEEPRVPRRLKRESVPSKHWPALQEILVKHRDDVIWRDPKRDNAALASLWALALFRFENRQFVRLSDEERVEAIEWALNQAISTCQARTDGLVPSASLFSVATTWMEQEFAGTRSKDFAECGERAKELLKRTMGGAA